MTEAIEEIPAAKASEPDPDTEEMVLRKGGLLVWWLGLIGSPFLAIMWTGSTPLLQKSGITLGILLLLWVFARQVRRMLLKIGADGLLVGRTYSEPISVPWEKIDRMGVYDASDGDGVARVLILHLHGSPIPELVTDGHRALARYYRVEEGCVAIPLGGFPKSIIEFSSRFVRMEREPEPMIRAPNGELCAGITCRLVPGKPRNPLRGSEAW